MGAFLAGGACVLGWRTAGDPTRDSRAAEAILAIAACAVALVGGFVALGEPAVFNAGYGCISRRPDAWLAVAQRPTPAPCGYLIPASDNSLFYTPAFAAFAAAVLALSSAAMNVIDRTSRRL